MGTCNTPPANTMTMSGSAPSHCLYGPNGWPLIDDLVTVACDGYEYYKARGEAAGLDVVERDVDAMLEKHKGRLANIRALAAPRLTSEQKEKFLDDDEWLVRY